MTIDEFKELVKDLPGDTELLTMSPFGHTYAPVENLVCGTFTNLDRHFSFEGTTGLLFMDAHDWGLGGIFVDDKHPIKSLKPNRELYFKIPPEKVIDIRNIMKE